MTGVWCLVSGVRCQARYLLVRIAVAGGERGHVYRVADRLVARRVDQVPQRLLRVLDTPALRVTVPGARCYVTGDRCQVAGDR